MIALGCVWLNFGSSTVLAQSTSITDADVDELIEHLVIIIKDRQRASR